MHYFVSRNGQQEGPYSMEEVRSRLASGQLDPADFVWHEKMTDWQQLGNTPPFSAPASVPAPPFAPRTEPRSSSRGESRISGFAITSLVLGLSPFFAFPF